MFDLSSEFNRFYNHEVVLKGDTQSDLFYKGKLNVKRLKEGLKIYNEKHGTSYRVSETITQGSMAMNTAVQSDSKDYDIDIAIVFRKDNVGDIGAQAIKNIVVEAMSYKCGQFNATPEKKTNCVRIIYSAGYHIDFAIYRKDIEYGNATYYHAGSVWNKRDPKAINNWFKGCIDAKGQNLRKAIRLSKMFCKSHDGWDMPGGLIQTVLFEEKFRSAERLDECFYNTMCSVRDRLRWNKEVNNPTDLTLSLLQTEAHRQRIEVYYNRLDSYLSKLNVLTQADCTREKALSAWADFFNHDYWTNLVTEASTRMFALESRRVQDVALFNDTEQFVEDMMPVVEQYDAEIIATAHGDAFREQPLQWFLTKFKMMPHHFTIKFTCRHNVPEPVEYFWKVKNVGRTAEKKNCVRGQVIKKTKTITESTNFYGPHYVECYVVKNGICVARARISVPIGNE
ncbi:MAG: nucleotidyltransferase [Bacteroidaceae bacterium]|nr:nucleotidyltransferase [Bacteroidaceae bacterium]